MAIKDVQDSENLAVAADDRIIAMLQTTGTNLKTVSDQLAAQIAAGGATPEQLDTLKSQIDSETSKVNAAVDAAGAAG